MKRDMDLVRLILAKVESWPPGHGGQADTLGVDGYDLSLVVHHAALMVDQGLLDGQVHKAMGDPDPMVLIDGLTWQGHEFLDAVRNETVWAKTKQIIAEKGGSATIAIVQQIASVVLMKQFGLGT